MATKKNYKSATVREENEGENPRPQAIRVFGKDFAVVTNPRGVIPSDASGFLLYNNQMVVLSEGLTPAEEADTLLHEITHAIDFTMGLELTERQVTQLATGLYGVLQDNPEFAKWLIERR